MSVWDFHISSLSFDARKKKMLQLVKEEFLANNSAYWILEFLSWSLAIKFCYFHPDFDTRRKLMSPLNRVTPCQDFCFYQILEILF